MIKNVAVRVFACIPLLWLSACQTPPTDPAKSTSATQPAKTSVQFADVAVFDRDLHAALQGNAGNDITVVMYDKVSPNSTPDRLQKWLNAVERNGGRVEIEPPPNELTPRNPLALISLVGGLWNAIKATADLRDAQLTQSVRGHDAVISLDRNAAGQVVIDKVIFKKTTKSPS